MRLFLLSILCIVVVGCATAKYQKYIGGSISQVMLDNGEPDSTVDLPDGRRAFQWERRYDRHFLVPANANNPDAGYVGVSREDVLRINLIARWDEAREDWIVEEVGKSKG